MEHLARWSARESAPFSILVPQPPHESPLDAIKVKAAHGTIVAPRQLTPIPAPRSKRMIYTDGSGHKPKSGRLRNFDQGPAAIQAHQALPLLLLPTVLN